MKIISWNIRAGGGVRAPLIVDYLLKERPGVIALCEFRGTAASESIARELACAGYSYQRTTVNKANRTVNSLLVASIYPLRRVNLSKAPAIASRWLALNVFAPRPFCLIALHVPNRSTGYKYDFLEAVSAVVNGWRGLPAMIVGDTNSGRVSVDEESRTFNRIEDRWVESMDTKGWKDAFRYLYPDGREYTWYSPNGRNGFRLDQMFIHPKLVSAIQHFSHEWVGATDARREVVSDHAALCLRLDDHY